MYLHKYILLIFNLIFSNQFFRCTFQIDSIALGITQQYEAFPSSSLSGKCFDKTARWANTQIWFRINKTKNWRFQWICCCFRLFSRILHLFLLQFLYVPLSNSFFVVCASAVAHRDIVECDKVCAWAGTRFASIHSIIGGKCSAREGSSIRCADIDCLRWDIVAATQRRRKYTRKTVSWQIYHSIMVMQINNRRLKFKQNLACLRLSFCWHFSIF